MAITVARRRSLTSERSCAAWSIIKLMVILFLLN
jgi:hypothetical protein